MRATLALLVAGAALAKADPGGGGDGGWGGHEDYTEYQTQVYTTAVVSQWYHVRPSVCETYSIWTLPPVTSVYTKISTYIPPGHTHPTTEYVPCTTTIHGKDTTITKSYTYTTKVTDTYSKTIFEPFTRTITIVSNYTVTMPTTVPTTIPTTIPTTETIQTTVPLPTTIVTTELYSTTYLSYSKITQQGTTQTLSFTETDEVTVLQTVPKTTIEEITVPITATLTQPGTTLTEYSTTEEQITYTASAPTIYSYVTITAPPVTITQAPPPPASTCNATGFFPAPDGNACGGESCYIDFDLDADVHWDTIDHYPPLLTVEQFENPSVKATCITTICNTASFNKYYSTSLLNCPRPPCPSNSLDCDCNIVVGPLVLPNGETTSVTQTGSSGWYLNLGPTATAVNIPTCVSGDPQCLTSVPTSRSAPLIYTGNVMPASPTGNMSSSMYNRYLLPGLFEYFPSDSPFGDCETAVFDSAGTTAGPRLRRAHLHRRQATNMVSAGTHLWAGTPNLIPTSTFSYPPQSAVTGPASSTSSPESSPSPSTQPPSTITVTPPSPQSTPSTSEAPPSPVTTEPNSSGSEPVTSPPNTSPPSAGGAPSSSTTGVVIPPTGSESNSTPESSPSATPGESIGSSIFIPTSVMTGPDGRITVTETVFYSMIPSPGSETSSSSTSATSSGPAQQTTSGSPKRSPGLLAFALAVLTALVILI